MSLTLQWIHGTIKLAKQLTENFYGVRLLFVTNFVNISITFNCNLKTKRRAFEHFVQSLPILIFMSDGSF